MGPLRQVVLELVRAEPAEPPVQVRPAANPAARPAAGLGGTRT
jgi:hypothetical protein